jgi:hypothetical protein
VRSLDLGFFFGSMSELGMLLRDRERLEAVRASVWQHRDQFTFDNHVPALIDYFRQVIQAHGLHKQRVKSVQPVRDLGIKPEVTHPLSTSFLGNEER